MLPALRDADTNVPLMVTLVIFQSALKLIGTPALLLIVDTNATVPDVVVVMGVDKSDVSENRLEIEGVFVSDMDIPVSSKLESTSSLGSNVWIGMAPERFQ